MNRTGSAGTFPAGEGAGQGPARERPQRAAEVRRHGRQGAEIDVRSGGRHGDDGEEEVPPGNRGGANDGFTRRYTGPGGGPAGPDGEETQAHPPGAAGASDGWDAGGPRVPDAVVRAYEVVGVLPRGGETLRVLKVTSRLTKSPRVVKLYRESHRQDERVMRALRQADHPHVVRLHEYGVEPDPLGGPGWPWEVLEYIPGGSLRDLLDAHGALAPARVRAVLEQMTDALHYLHTRLRLGGGRGAAHRDVSPFNILLRDSGGELDTALADFGLVAEVRETRQTNMIAGNLLYQAPETTRGADRRPAQDWWSLGVVVVEMLTGRNPNAVPGGWGNPVAFWRHLDTHDVDLSGVTDARWLLLCQGLLTREPEHRWGHPQVTAWLRGGSPPVHRAAHRHSGRPFGLAGETHHDLDTLAEAMAGSRWEDVRDLFLSATRLEALRAWLLREFGGGGIPDHLVAAPAQDAREAMVRAAEFRVAVLRDAPPAFAGAAADAPALAALTASRAVPDRRVAALVGGRLLRVLSYHPCASRAAAGHRGCGRNCAVLANAAEVLPKAEEDLRRILGLLSSRRADGSTGLSERVAELRNSRDLRAHLLHAVLVPGAVRVDRMRIAALRRTPALRACPWWMRLADDALRERESPAALVLARFLAATARNEGRAAPRRPGERRQRWSGRAGTLRQETRRAARAAVSATAVLCADLVTVSLLFVASMAVVYAATAAWLMWAGERPVTAAARYARDAADLQYVLSVPLAMVLLAVVLLQRSPGPATGAGVTAVVLSGGLLALTLWTDHGPEIRFPYVPGRDFHDTLLEANRSLGGDPDVAAVWLAVGAVVFMACVVAWAHNGRRDRAAGYRPRGGDRAEALVWARVAIVLVTLTLLVCAARGWPLPLVPEGQHPLW